MQKANQGLNNTDVSNQELFEGDIILPGKTPIGGIVPSAIYENRIWPTKKIPYVISSGYSMTVHLFFSLLYDCFFFCFQPKLTPI